MATIEADLVSVLDTGEWSYVADFDAEDYQVATPGEVAGSRIYPLVLPQSPTLPAITYQRVSSPRLWSIGGPTGRAHPRFQVRSWASTPTAARDLAERVRRRLDGFSGTFGTRTVHYCRIVGQLDDYERLEDGTDLFSVIQDFVVSHVETL